ncbi:hypothetical protein NM688_g7457 [Phlebia brevispora]|uniref:Uncharacterized protein n=1 Tax=Phlebia brevispora TaxID=194682 RepID=A0ACC1S4W9_9APHY|nr:hypothetical protein NM688_g7457 [Phlebia brevispora]
MTGLSALIFGATGASGRYLLRELLQSDKFDRIGEYGRRVTPSADLPGTEKLEQKVIDFENLDPTMIKKGKWDVVFITLGSNSRAAGSPEAFEKIDRQYVLDVAQAAKSEDPDRKQRLVYLSSGGANSKSRFLYMRSKGLTEDGLASMGYDFISIRAGFLMDAERDSVRPIAEYLIKPFFSFVSYFTTAAQIPVPSLARGMRRAGELGTPGIPPTMRSQETHDGVSFTLIDNSQALNLAAMP